MLTRSPLIMVLAQIRFPMEAIGLKPANYSAVDAAMNAAGFPLVKTDTGASVNLGMGGTLQLQGHPESRMYYRADLNFAVTVNPTFVSLYCVDRGDGIPYAGHEAFIEMLCDVVRGLESVLGGIAVERIGYRYVDALQIKDALDVLREPFRGAVSLAEDDDFGLSVASTTVEAFLAIGDGAPLGSEPAPEGIHVACGTVAPQALIDPAIPPKMDPRWIVDIDAYSTSGFAFSEGEVRNRAYSLADESRRLFYGRIVNDQFTARFE